MGWLRDWYCKTHVPPHYSGWYPKEDPMAKNVGDVALAMSGVGENVPLKINGADVDRIQALRNSAGDLELHLTSVAPGFGVAGPSAVVPVPEPALADPGHEPRDQAPEIETQVEIPEASDRLDELAERRQNDPESLTAEEREELARLEKLAGVEERRHASHESPLLADESAGQDEPL